MKDGKLKRTLLAVWDEIHYARKLLFIRKNYGLSIMTAEETVVYIKEHCCSVARYGDGELSLMLQSGEPGFQKGSTELASALLHVLKNTSPDLLICMPRALVSTKGFRKKGKQFWKSFAIESQEKVVSTIRKICGDIHRFGDTNVSRPYSPYKTSRMAEKMFPLLKSLWDDRDILIVEGSQTRLGVGNDLFADARSIKRILAPAENAFDRYSEILQTVRACYKGELIILALGPTATVLASDLSKDGIQALDMGHIDIQYEWYLSGDNNFHPVPGKYTNEAAGGHVVAECKDKIYLSQIVASVT